MPALPAPMTEGRMMEATTWTEADEQAFRRDVLLNAPEKAAHLEPWPRIDWWAASTIRELAPPSREPYKGEERRKGWR